MMSDCKFIEYTVARHGDTEVKVEGKTWKEAIKKIEEAIMLRKDLVITIIGEPGMGKTTILNAVKKDLGDKQGNYIIYIDLVNSPNLSSAFWHYLKTTIVEKIRVDSYNVLSSNKREIGYTVFAKLGKEFNNWLRHMCEKRRWDEKLGYAQRLYCMTYDESVYPKDVVGVILFIKDLLNLGIVGLLIDEVKPVEGQLSEIHKLINECKVPIALAMTNDVMNEIKDRALKRRLSEFTIELKLNQKDREEILRGYCPDFSEELLEVKEVMGAETVSKLIDIAREVINTSYKHCEGEYDIKGCVKMKIKSAFDIGDINEASKRLEQEVREGLLELKDLYGIDYVHKKGKRIEEMGVIVDIYFRKGKVEYIGDIKLSNKDTIEESSVANMKKLESYFKNGDYDVVKFIITNVSNVDITNFKVIRVDNRSLKKILEGDREERNALIKRVVEELGLLERKSQ